MEITVEINGKTYLVKIRDLNANPVMAEVDGQSYAVYPGGAPAGVLPQTAPAHSPEPVQAAAPAAPAAPAAQTAPAPAAEPGGANVLRAPLPGTIVEVKVKPGDSVKNGQTLLVLEAMKMKNDIKASKDAVVANVHVNPGNLVKHNEPLISFK
jgi:biotin carboxyl carrier protein